MKIPFGPTYDEMLDPGLINSEVRSKALEALHNDELDAINLFNINWNDSRGEVRRLILPPGLTGVPCNIIVLLGCGFPSGSHKVGPAYATLMEGCLDGKIIPGEHTILGPSTGNFGIGVAYICRLMGYRSIVIMPDSMSRERYQRIQQYGGMLDLTPGTESDVILTLERTRELMKDPSNVALAQFELMPNYRFHRHVTGGAALKAASDVGNGRVACFASAPGSAGTIAAGDQIKKVFPEAVIAALEPHECATLSKGGRGQHRIEGIGDKMCTLIHNVGLTDYVVLVSDSDCISALALVHNGTQVLKAAGIDEKTASVLRDCFGISGFCNVLGSIKMAKHLGLGAGENVVTVATDGFDRYPSVLENAGADADYARVLDKVFHDCNGDVFDFRSPGRKEQLFMQKQKDWQPFGYDRTRLDVMREQDFWDEQYSLTEVYSKKLLQARA